MWDEKCATSNAWAKTCTWYGLPSFVLICYQSISVVHIKFWFRKHITAHGNTAGVPGTYTTKSHTNNIQNRSKSLLYFEKDIITFSTSISVELCQQTYKVAIRTCKLRRWYFQQAYSRRDIKNNVSGTGCVHENMIRTSPKTSSKCVSSHQYYVHGSWYDIALSQTCFDMCELIWRHDRGKHHIYDSHWRICGLEHNKHYRCVLTILTTQKYLFYHAQKDGKIIKTQNLSDSLILIF